MSKNATIPEGFTGHTEATIEIPISFFYVMEEGVPYVTDYIPISMRFDILSARDKAIILRAAIEHAQKLAEEKQLDRQLSETEVMRDFRA